MVWGRSRRPCGLRIMYAAAWLLRSWFRIPLRTWMFVCFICCVLCRQRLLRSALHSFRRVLLGVCVCVCVCLIVRELETSNIRRLGPILADFWTTENKWSKTSCLWDMMLQQRVIGSRLRKEHCTSICKGPEVWEELFCGIVLFWNIRYRSLVVWWWHPGSAKTCRRATVYGLCLIFSKSTS